MIKSFLNKMKPRNLAIERWTKCNGDEIYRLDYDLDENSLVFDLGGYKAILQMLLLKSLIVT